MNIDWSSVMLVIVVIVYVELVFFALMYETNKKEKNYTYYLDETFGISNECYIKNDNAYCMIDSVETKVDLYYEND